MSSFAERPRMKNWSPFITPPSPICVVMPGTLRSACSSEVTPCSDSVSGRDHVDDLRRVDDARHRPIEDGFSVGQMKTLSLLALFVVARSSASRRSPSADQPRSDGWSSSPAVGPAAVGIRGCGRLGHKPGRPLDTAKRAQALRPARSVPQIGLRDRRRIPRTFYFPDRSLIENELQKQRSSTLRKLRLLSTSQS